MRSKNADGLPALYEQSLIVLETPQSLDDLVERFPVARSFSRAAIYDEIAWALRVSEAAREARTKGLGAFLVDGRMIDAPFIRRAETVLAVAKRFGLVPT